MKIFTIETEITNQEGHPVTRQRDALIEIDSAGSARSTSTRRPDQSQTASSPTKRRDVTHHEAPVFPVRQLGPLTRVDIARYAGAAGDFNPLHIDEAFAVANGFPSVFAMGPLGAGFLAQTLAQWVGPQNVREYSVRFTGQVWPGDILSAEGIVEHVDSTSSPTIASLKLTLSRQTSETVVAGLAFVALRHAPTGQRA